MCQRQVASVSTSVMRGSLCGDEAFYWAFSRQLCEGMGKAV